jgi:hypothetical protein
MLPIAIVTSSAEGAALCYRTICVEGAERVQRNLLLSFCNV